MDTLTHSLVGALTARALPTGRNNPIGIARWTWAGAIAGAFPDIDFLTQFIDPLRYLAEWHRGPTHSLVLLPFWTLMLALALGWTWRRQGAQWQTLLLVCGAALAAHIAADVITSYGTLVFWPLSDYRAATATTFIIDPWFTLIVIVGLTLAIRHQSRRVAALGLAVLLLYVGLEFGLQHRAENLAAEQARAMSLRDAKVQALAQPISPFRWKLVIRQPDRYHEALVDLAGLQLTLPGDPDSWWQVLTRAYPPPDGLSWRTFLLPESPAQPGWAREAWRSPALAPYRRFALLPVVYDLDNGPERRCVRFVDRRFELPGLKPPFVIAACTAGGGKIEEPALRLYPNQPMPILDQGASG